MQTITINGVEMQAEIHDVEFAAPGDTTVLDGTHDIEAVEMTFTLQTTFWQLMTLARMIAPQNPKKAKRIRNMAKPYNPLKMLGLI